MSFEIVLLGTNKFWLKNKKRKKLLNYTKLSGDLPSLMLYFVFHKVLNGCFQCDLNVFTPFSEMTLSMKLVKTLQFYDSNF